jgi:hypothetical protein
MQSSRLYLNIFSTLATRAASCWSEFLRSHLNCTDEFINVIGHILRDYNYIERSTVRLRGRVNHFLLVQLMFR